MMPPPEVGHEQVATDPGGCPVVDGPAGQGVLEVPESALCGLQLLVGGHGLPVRLHQVQILHPSLAGPPPHLPDEHSTTNTTTTPSLFLLQISTNHLKCFTTVFHPASCSNNEKPDLTRLPAPAPGPGAP